jgi:hypothetical protein
MWGFMIALLAIAFPFYITQILFPFRPVNFHSSGEG